MKYLFTLLSIITLIGCGGSSTTSGGGGSKSSFGGSYQKLSVPVSGDAPQETINEFINAMEHTGYTNAFNKWVTHIHIQSSLGNKYSGAAGYVKAYKHGTGGYGEIFLRYNPRSMITMIGGAAHELNHIVELVSYPPEQRDPPGFGFHKNSEACSAKILRVQSSTNGICHAF